MSRRTQRTPLGINVEILVEPERHRRIVQRYYLQGYSNVTAKKSN